MIRPFQYAPIIALLHLKARSPLADASSDIYARNTHPFLWNTTLRC